MQTLEERLEPTGWTVYRDKDGNIRHFRAYPPLGGTVYVYVGDGVSPFDAVVDDCKSFNPSIYVRDILLERGEDIYPSLAEDLCENAVAIGDLYEALRKAVGRHYVETIARDIRSALARGDKDAASAMTDGLRPALARAVRRKLGEL